MINAIPFIGWLLSLFFNVSLAIPFWIVWTACGIGQKFGYFLPPVYQSIDFWNCVGLFIAVSIIKHVFIPKFVSVSNEAKAGDK